MKTYTVDLINIPTGMSEDIRQFCVPILEVALLRGETEYNFDNEFLYSLLDTKLSENEEKVILYNAQRYLDDKRHYPDPELTDRYQEELERGCLYFVDKFLYLNQLHATHIVGKDIWKIELVPLTVSLWKLIKYYHPEKDK